MSYESAVHRRDLLLRWQVWAGQDPRRRAIVRYAIQEHQTAHLDQNKQARPVQEVGEEVRDEDTGR